MASLDRMISSSRRALEQRRGARPLAELEAGRRASSSRSVRSPRAVVGEEISFVLRVTEADPALLAAAGGGRSGRTGRAERRSARRDSTGDVAAGAAQGRPDRPLPAVREPARRRRRRRPDRRGVRGRGRALRRDADGGAAARPGRRGRGRRRGGGRARPRSARPGLVPDPEPARRQGTTPTSSTPSRCSRRCRPARSCCRRAASATATRCSRSRAPASTPPCSAGGCSGIGIALDAATSCAAIAAARRIVSRRTRRPGRRAPAGRA